MKYYDVKLLIQIFSRTHYLDSPIRKLISKTVYCEETKFRNVCTILRKVVTQNFRFELSQNHVILLRCVSIDNLGRLLTMNYLS